MQIETFMRNWVLHYIQPPYLYLPETNKSKKKRKIIIRPISYIHEAVQQQGTNEEHTFQYFFANYEEPLTTGTLVYEPSKFQAGTEEKPDPIPQSPCLYRIYRYRKDDDKFYPITTDGNFDLECSENSLYKNANTFQLIPDEKYYYREEQASEGDLLHKELEEFGIDEDSNIILYQSEIDDDLYNRIEAAAELNEQTGEYDQILKIRHYPKMVKVYATFDMGYEKPTITNDLDENGNQRFYNFSAEAWLGSSYIKEGWTGGVADDPTSFTEINVAKRYRVYPKELKITYMEKPVERLQPYYKKIESDTPIEQIVYYKLERAAVIDNGGSMFGGGRYGEAIAKKVTLPNVCAPEWYLGDTLLHKGEEISWGDTTSPNWELYSESETREYGHYFKVPNDGGGDLAIANGSLKDTFWYRKYPVSFLDLYETQYYTEQTGVFYWYKYKTPYKFHKEMTKKVNGIFSQEIVENSGFKKPLVQLKLEAGEIEVTQTNIEYDNNQSVTNVTVEKKIDREKGVGYGWAGIEDVLGMACWCMAQLTKYDPNGNYSDPYHQWNCLPGMPLYIAWGQYENSKTKDFVKDTLSIQEKYNSDDPLMPYDSPIIRKGKFADYDVSYAIYDQDKFNFIDKNCDLGCSCVVSYIKTTRRKYFNFLKEKDPTPDNWVVIQEKD